MGAINKMEDKMNANDYYDMYANQADPRDLLLLGRTTIIRQIEELNEEAGIDDNENAEFIADYILEIARETVRNMQETRDYILRVRLTEHERFALSRTAKETGQTMSEYVRRKIFP
jgi:hypothetical protein